MKTLRILPLLATASLLVFSSCDKDDDVTTETALQRLQKVWKVDKLTTVYYTTPASATINYTGQASDYYDFRTNGKLYTSVNGGLDTLDYNLINNTTIVVNNNGSIDTGRITTLTNSKLVGVTKFKINSTEYSEVTAELSR
ncbi:MAG: hypothetical protein EOO13_17955 [Chitinophagaceae bacterium]|nr:MAG: hypothetical protein EOO13_17955 [Chitinophagaceae bacterium]